VHLRQVELRQWACHDALAVELGPGLNVCVGRNGVGKSTLYQAILAALTLKHTAKGQEITVFEPWGTRGFGPTVVLDLVRADGPWRLSKTYLHKPTCVLERRREGESGWSAHASGKAAEEILEHWLGSDGAAGRLLLALWSPQHDPTQAIGSALKNPGPAPATVLEQVLERVRRPESSGPFTHVQQAVERQYSQSFTPVRRDIRRDSPLDLALRELEAAESHLAAVAQARRDLDERIATFQSKTALHADRCADRERLRAEKSLRDRALVDYDADAAALADSEARARALREAHDRLAQAADLVTRSESSVADLRSRRDSARAEYDEAGRRAEAARQSQSVGGPALDDLAGLLDRLKLLDDRDHAVRARRDAHNACAQALADAAEAEARARERLASASADLQRAEHAVALAGRRQARADLDAAQARLDTAGAALVAAEAARNARDRASCRVRLDAVVAIRRELDALAHPDDGGPVPSVEQLTELRQARDELARLDHALSADGLTLRFEAESPVRARVSADGSPPVEHGLAPGEAVEASGVAGLTLVIEGVGRITLGRNATSPADQLRLRDEARQSLAERLGAWGVDDYEALEERRRRAEARDVLRDRLAGRLAGETPESLEVRLAELDDWFHRHNLTPESTPPLPDSTSSLDSLREARDRARSDVEAARARLADLPEIDDAGADSGMGIREAEHNLATARQALRDAEAKARAAETALIRAESEARSAARDLDEAEHALAEEAQGDPDGRRAELDIDIRGVFQTLVPLDAVPRPLKKAGVLIIKRRLADQAQRSRAKHDEVSTSLNDLERRLAAAEASLREHRARFAELAPEAADADGEARARLVKDSESRCLLTEAEVRRAREALPPDPRRLDDDLDGRVARCEAECDRLEHELITLRAELNARGAEGLDSRLAEAEERRARALRVVADRRRDAAAWALLHHLLAEVEADQARGIAARLEALAAELVPRLTGRNVGAIALDPQTLAPVRARADGRDLLADLDRFSRGTREQVALACRLQIGLLLGQESRPMLLLDDPLPHTDPDRHREALRVLVDLAERLQLIIFTCHRDRYAPLWTDGPARLIEVDSPAHAHPVGRNGHG
jgi:DNA repair exonuclease SbcCD ATPase subunit